ncbi:MAG: hypothetical protein J6Y20_07430 [Lachnospiraceae bacterium]|nr:hypothetical protein [Lachnospiraceae bacterium]
MFILEREGRGNKTFSFETIDEALQFVKKQRMKEVYKLSHGEKSMRISFSQTIWFRWTQNFAFATPIETIKNYFSE